MAQTSLPPPISSHVETLRQRAREFGNMAERARSPAVRQACDDAAMMYQQMAQSISELEALRGAMREREASYQSSSAPPARL
jgi:hypothetical protein